MQIERYPRLELVCAEGDAGWMPHYTYRMDHAARTFAEGGIIPGLSKLPSAYLRSNVWTTFQDDWVAFQAKDLMSHTQLLWADDYPHTSPRRRGRTFSGTTSRGSSACRSERTGQGDRPRWFAEGRDLAALPLGSQANMVPPQRGVSKHVDRMYEAGFYEGLPHPVTPELRLKDQEIDGVDAEVIYGIFSIHRLIEDRELLRVIYHAYNDYAADLCKARPERLVALACIPNDDPLIAAAEVRRAASMGLRGVDFGCATAVKPIWHRDWDPLWEAVQECEQRSVPGDLVDHVPARRRRVPGRDHLLRGAGTLSADEVRPRRVRRGVAAVRAVAHGRGVRRPVPAPGPLHEAE
jgi:predicted TIM-barrel fold metal-dependent hydrolase